MDKKYLSEEKYKKGKNILKTIALIILLIGLCVGFYFILKGFIISNSKEKSNLDSYESKLNEEKAILEDKKGELEEKNVVPSEKYDSGESYDLYVLVEVLNPSKVYCEKEYLRNSMTNNYCTTLNKINDINSDGFYYFLGIYIIIIAFIISVPIYIIAHRREIIAYKLQEVMPIAKEGIEEMTPTISKAAGTIAKEVSDSIRKK